MPIEHTERLFTCSLDAHVEQRYKFFIFASAFDGCTGALLFDSRLIADFKTCLPIEGGDGENGCGKQSDIQSGDEAFHC